MGLAKKIARVIRRCENDNNDYLEHYGTKRHSGRYPWGSGKEPYQHSGDFMARVNELKGKGLTEKEIADAVGLTTTQLRVQKALAKNEQRELEVDRAKKLREKGYSLQKVAEMMGYNNDSSVRTLLNESSEERMLASKKTADFLKEQVDKKGMIDVGKGVELELGVSNEKMKEALYILEREGYEVFGAGVPQVTNPGKQTNIKVLAPPGTEHKDVYNFDDIHTINDYHSDDGGETFRTFQYPASLDSKRVKVRYAEEGGIDKDGLIEIRRGCKDLDMGDSKYCQVRIMVDGTHYLKGMAVYSDDLPKGCDVMFNTNKHVGKPLTEVLKPIKSDPENPFGALIKAGGQSYYIGKDGKEHLSPLNKTREEGDWQKWSDKVPSQFLSKQNLALIKKQLGVTKAEKDAEFNEIMSLTNPTVKKRLLQSFADDCDSAAVHLKAASLPGQKYHVILPSTTLKDNEVYAPKYKDGETIALVRFPHGGTFEIPILKVNNKNKECKGMIGSDAIDAICINSKNAERLSGADFDGDTVMSIPTGGKIKITSTPALKGLVGFDAKDISQYGTVKKEDGQYYNKYGKPIKVMKNTQTEMGKISNLITDMTVKGAKPDELARAVRHSMVVIDAEKHKLDYKTSEKENNIAALRARYQTHIGLDGKEHDGGASTLLSRAKAQQEVLKRKGTPHIDPKTGDMTGQRLAELTILFRYMMEVLISSEQTMNDLKRAFEGVFAAIDILTSILNFQFNFAGMVVNNIIDLLGGNVLHLAGDIGELIVQFRDWLKNDSFIAAAMNQTAMVVATVIVKVIEFAQAMGQLVDSVGLVTALGTAFSSTVKIAIDCFSAAVLIITSFVNELANLDHIDLQTFMGLLQKLDANFVTHFSKMGAVFEPVKKAFDELFEKLGLGKKHVNDFGENTVSTFSKVKGAVGNSLPGKVVGTYINILKSLASAAVEFATTIRNKGVGDGIIGFLMGVVSAVQNAASKLRLGNTNIAALLGEVLGIVALFKIAKSLTKVADAFMEALEAFGGILKGFEQVFKGINSVLTSYAKNLRAEALMKTAGAIAILAASVYALAQLDSDKLWSSVKALIALTAALAGLSIALSKFGGGLKGALSRTGVMGIGVGILSLVTSLKILDSLNPKKLQDDIKALITVMIAFAGLTKITSSVGSGMTKSAGFFLAIGVSVRLLANSLKTIDKMDDPNKAVTTIAKLMLVMRGLMAASKLRFGQTGGFGKDVLLITASLLVMVKALKKIAGLDTDAMSKNAGAFVLVFGSLIGLMGMCKILSTGGAIVDKAGSTILAMSAALMLVATAMRIIAGIDEKSLTKVGIVTAGILGIFGALTAISSISGANAGKAGAMILAMSSSLLLICAAMAIMSRINPDDLNHSAEIILALEAMFAVIVGVSHFARDATGTFKMVAISIGILTAALVTLSFIDKNAVQNAALCLGGVVAALAAVVLATGQIKAGGTTNLAVLAVIIGEIGGILGLLSGLKPNESVGIAESLGIVLLALAASVAIISKSNSFAGKALGTLAVLSLITIALSAIITGMAEETKNIETVIGCAVSLGILINALASACLILSETGPVATSAMVAAGVLMVITGVLGSVIGKMSEYTDAETAIGVAVSLGVLLNALASACVILSTVGNIAPTALVAAGVLSVLTVILGSVIGKMAEYTDAVTAIGIAVSLGLLLNALAGACVILDAVVFNPGALATAAVLSGIVVILGSVIGKMSECSNAGTALGIAVSLGVLLNALAAACVILDAAVFNPGALATAGVLTAIVAALAVIIGKLSEYTDAKKAIGIATGLSTLLIALSVACAILTVVGLGGPAALIGVASLAALVAAMGTLMVAIGALMEYVPQAQKFLQNGIKVLAAIGDGLGQFVGKFVGGVLEGVTSVLPKVAMNLTAFMVGLSPFIAIANTIKPSIGESIKTIAEAILILTAANLLDQVNKFLGGGDSFTKFAEQLPAFGEALADFATTLQDAGVNPAFVQMCAYAAKAIAEFAQTIPNEGGVLAKITGDNTLTQFAKGLSAFADPFVDFCSSLKKAKINKKTVETAMDAAKAITAFATTIPNEGGILAKITGDNKLSDFAEELQAFGDPFVEFCKTIKKGKINKDTISNAMDAANTISAFANTLKNHDGLSAKIFGDNNLKNFAEELKAFGKPFVEYCGIIMEASIDAKTIKKSSAAAQSIVDFSNTLGTGDGVFSIFTGKKKTLEEFGANLEIFGRGFAAYYDNVKDVNGDIVDTSVAIADSLLKLSKKIAKADDINLENYGEQLIVFGRQFKTFYTDLGKMDAFRMQGVADAVSKLLSSMAKATKDSAAGKFGKTLATLGKTSTQDFLTPFMNADTKVANAVKTMLKNATEAISSRYNTFKSSGKYVVDGLVAGMKSKYSDVVATAQNLGNTVKNSLNKSLDVHSPSRETAKTGRFVGEGLIKGIDSTIPKVHILGEQMGETAGNAISAGATRPIKKIGGGILDVIATATNAVSQRAKNYMNETGVKLGDGLYDGFKAQTEKIPKDSEDTANAAIDSMSTNLDTGSEKVSKSAAKLGKKTKESLKKSLPTAAEITRIGHTLNKALGNLFKSKKKQNAADYIMGKDALTQIQKNLKKADSFFKEYTDGTETKSGKIKYTLKDVAEAFKKLKVSIKDGLKDCIYSFEKLTTKSDTSLSKMIKNMKSNIQLVKQFGERFQTLVDAGMSKKIASYIKGRSEQEQMTFITQLYEAGPKGLAKINQLFAKAAKQHKKTTDIMTTCYAILEGAVKKTSKEKKKAVKDWKKDLDEIAEKRKKDVKEWEKDINRIAKATGKSSKKVKKEIEAMAESLKSVGESIKNNFKLFEYGDKVKVKDLMTGAKSQLGAMGRWLNGMNQLISMGASKTTVEYFQKAELSGLSELEALVGSGAKKVVSQFNKILSKEAYYSSDGFTNKLAEIQEKLLNGVKLTKEEKKWYNKILKDAKELAKVEKKRTDLAKQREKDIEYVSRITERDTKLLQTGLYFAEAINRFGDKDLIYLKQKEKYEGYINGLIVERQRLIDDGLTAESEEVKAIDSLIEDAKDNLQALGITEFFRKTYDAEAKAREKAYEDFLDRYEAPDNTYGTAVAIALTNRLKETYKDTGEAARIAGMSIEAFGEGLYKKSSYYTEDRKALEAEQRSLQTLRENQAKAQGYADEAKKAYDDALADYQRRLKLSPQHGGFKNDSEAAQVFADTVDKIYKEWEKWDGIVEDFDKDIKTSESTIEHWSDTKAGHTKEVFENLVNTVTESFSGLLDPLQATFDSGIKLFEEFGEQSEDTAETILTNMKSQIEGVSKWRENLKKLSSMGLEQGLIDELEAMGTAGAGKVAAIANMSFVEIQQMNAYYRRQKELDNQTWLDNIEKNKKAAEARVRKISELAAKGWNNDLLTDLAGMGEGANEVIERMLCMTPEQQNAITQSYLAKPEKLESLVTNLLAGIIPIVEKTGEEAGQALNNGTVSAAEQTGKETGKALSDGITENGTKGAETVAEQNAETLSSEAGEKVGEDYSVGINTGIQNETPTLVQTATDSGNAIIDALTKTLSSNKHKVVQKVTSIIKACVSEINKSCTSWINAGQYCAAGLAYGIRSKINEVAIVAANLVRAAMGAARETADINSPSKKFMEIGYYMVLGLSNGLHKYADYAVNEAENLVNRLMSPVELAMTSLSDVVSEDMELSPVITPVLDLSSVRDEAMKLDTMFANERAMSLSASVEAQKLDAVASQNGGDGTTTIVNNEYKMEQNNYSPMALSRTEIYRQTKNQFAQLRRVVDNA